MLHDGCSAVVVDPGEFAPVIEALASRNPTLAGILVTHHPGNRVAGLEGLRRSLEGPLPGDTRVCCAHEYTLSNLRFAHAVEPRNDNVTAYARWCEQQRARGEPTLPSSIAQERRVNPFLRCDEPEVVHAARHHGAASDAPVDVFAALREWKNEF